ncbi:hypothetical protein JXA56_02595 [Candidatus Micrarchaeota archaeon]|nr:hypothetical protein [Candidatus Micrarchaeota archaeon]
MAGKKLSMAERRKLAAEQAKKQRIGTEAQKPAPDRNGDKTSVYPERKKLVKIADDEGDVTRAQDEPQTREVRADDVPSLAQLTSSRPPALSEPDPFAIDDDPKKEESEKPAKKSEPPVDRKKKEESEKPAKKPESFISDSSVFSEEVSETDLPEIDENDPFNIGEPEQDSVLSERVLEAPASSEGEKPEETTGKQIDTKKMGATTSLLSGIVVRLDDMGQKSKSFVVRCSRTKDEHEVNVKKGEQAEVIVKTHDGDVKIIFVHDKKGDVTAEIEGGKTKLAKASDALDRGRSFFGNLKYYLPEIKNAVAGVVLSTAMLLVSGVKETLGAAHVPVSIAVGAVVLGFVTLSFLDRRKDRNNAELKEEIE